MSNLIKRIFLLFLLGVMGSASAYVIAQEDDASRVIRIRNQVSANELRQVADQIFNEQVSPEFTQLLYDTLNDRQREIITQRIAELAGVPFSSLEREGANGSGGDGPSPLSPGYNVQMPAGTGDPNVAISSHWSDSMCDSDPNDNDWIFFANTPQTVSPSSMRWYATSSLVTWAFNTAYGGVLSTYGYHLYQINVCLGTNGVLLAGGASHVHNNLKIKYR